MITRQQKPVSLITLAIALSSLLATATVHCQDDSGPAVEPPASPQTEHESPVLVDEVFVTSINDNRSVYVINENNQSIEVFLYCESSNGWRNHFAMVDANSHKLICDDVLNDSVYFWAKSRSGDCVWDGKDKPGSKSIVHPVDNVEYETLHYDINLENKIVGIPVSGCGS